MNGPSPPPTQGEVGLACITLANPVLVLCQFSDSATYPRTLTKLLAINPTQILVPGILGRESVEGRMTSTYISLLTADVLKVGGST